MGQCLGKLTGGGGRSAGDGTGSGGGLMGDIAGGVGKLLNKKGGGKGGPMDMLGDLTDMGGQLGGGGGANVDITKMIGGMVGGPQNLGKLIGDGLHKFLGVDPSTGHIIGSIAGNLIFNLGGKDNVLGSLGKVVLDNIISGKWKRDVDPFVPPDVPVHPGDYDGDSGPRPIPPRQDAESQDFYEIRKRALNGKQLFEDPDFAANDSSLFFSQKPPKKVTWLRPAEICKEPLFFEEGHTRFDVKQGELGDCWMLVAVACLTLRDELFYRVVPPDQGFTENYAGVFHFQFWQYGKWVDVVIDDRLPTVNGRLMYLHSASNSEFWAALVEKAYAKLHGSYEALKGGTSIEALEDFTGGLTELINLKQDPPKNLMPMILKAYQMGSLLCSSIQGSAGQTSEGQLPNGLVTGHAYSITGIKVVNGPDGTTPLLRIRNPWGSSAEWNGPWSDNSRQWRSIPEADKEALDLKFDHDGEFWMSFNDYMANFDTLEICNLGPDVMNEIQDMTGTKPITQGEWSTKEHHTSWIKGRSAGGCRNFIDTFATNPQIMVKLTDPDPLDADETCPCILSVVQKYRRQLKHKGLDMLPVGFAVYQLDSEPTGPVPKSFFASHKAAGRSPVFINLREVCGRFRFPPGVYVMLPSTFEPGTEGDIMVRVFSEGALKSTKL